MFFSINLLYIHIKIVADKFWYGLKNMFHSCLEHATTTLKRTSLDIYKVFLQTFFIGSDNVSVEFSGVFADSNTKE